MTGMSACVRSCERACVRAFVHESMLEGMREGGSELGGGREMATECKIETTFVCVELRLFLVLVITKSL